jgi:methylsterol monooxygenase
MNLNKKMKELGDDSAFYVIAYISSIAFVQTPLAQELWTSLYTNYSNQFIGKFLTLTQSLGLYWMLSLAFMVIDLKGWLQQFKIQKNVQVSIKDYKKCIPTVLKNQCFITIPLAILSNSDRLYILPTLPSASTMIWNLTFFYFCKALAFYYIHRLVHHPKLYKKVHKKHHEYIAPIAMATIYSTATEHLIANTIPTVVGPIILGLFGRTHMVTVWLFYNILTINTAINHW